MTDRQEDQTAPSKDSPSDDALTSAATVATPKGWTLLQKICIGYVVVLFGAASLNYIPGLTDSEGRAFGIFALDLFDDGLHVASGLWALAAALLGHRAARHFLTWFGAIYLGDGVLGLITGSGYLDAGILLYGVQDYSLLFKLAANAPHLSLGGFALFAGLFWGNRKDAR
jgi:hypothetical protein